MTTETISADDLAMCRTAQQQAVQAEQQMLKAKQAFEHAQQAYLGALGAYRFATGLVSERHGLQQGGGFNLETGEITRPGDHAPAPAPVAHPFAAVANGRRRKRA